MTDYKTLLLGYKEKNGFDFYFSLIAVIICILAIINNLVSSYWISPVFVDGQSMRETIQDGELLYMDALAVKFDNYKVGDVVVIKVDNQTNYIKRLIGVGGDRIYNDSDGKIHREYKDKNGKVVSYVFNDDYCYFYDGIRQTFGVNKITHAIENGKLFDVTLKEDEIFVLGDNRKNSKDSRYFLSVNNTCIKKSQLLGVVNKSFIENKKSYQYLKNWYIFKQNVSLKFKSFFNFK